MYRIKRKTCKATGIVCFYLYLVMSCTEQKHVSENAHDLYVNLTQDERLLPHNATKAFATATGVEVSLFASEPMVINPTNMDIDHRGRIWVLESPDYGKSKEAVHEGGRIVILEDKDQDGKADKRTVYYSGEDVHLALGIAVLGNKIYVSRSPDLLVFTDENGDDIPDKKEKLFTGMGKPGDHSAHAVIFGPDGKLYWNMGNSAGPVKDAEGKQITDQAGNEVVQNGADYLGGMVFRCNPDGSDFEVLAHNFRNNYEVTVDSYGSIWQSDNDDDGNESVRINYVMECGNYGYLDEVTRESWQAHRTNLEEEINRRHWHQNDPGVVPNLLITGSGSPAGITIYEGTLLPDIFRNQIIHTDAGPNVTRCYPITKNGAGYRASIENLVKSVYDQWSRPVDITTAPDGSVFIADWYDPIVGGGAAGEFERGRIFRVAPEVNDYRIKRPDTTTIDGAIEALKSPNIATRYLGWMALHRAGKDAEPALLQLSKDPNAIFQARALWLLGKIPGLASKYIQHAIKDANPDLRVVALRMARQSDIDFLEIARLVVNDPAPEVRREAAIGLHLLANAEAAAIWADLALPYDGEDRWYLEALGIGAANNWDLCLDHWLEKVEPNWKIPAHQDLIWRSRSAKALPYLGALIASEETSTKERPRYFRAFDFHADDRKYQFLLDLLSLEHSDKSQIRSLALQHLDPSKIIVDQKVREALDQTLQQLEDTPAYLQLVKKFNLTSKKDELIKLILDRSKLADQAAKMLLDPNTFHIQKQLASLLKERSEYASAIIEALQSIGNRSALELLSDVVMDSAQELHIRKEAIIALGKTWSGEDALLNTVKDSQFDHRLDEVAAGVLFNVYRVSIQEDAANYLTKPAFSGGEELPTLRELVVSIGNHERGKQVFDTYCQTCHQVGTTGTDFGPKLTEIGQKLSREGLYRAIMYPNEGISYGYEGKLVTLKDGTSLMGIIESESAEVIDLRLVGGIKNRVLKSDVEKLENHPQSIMPNLSISFSKDQLVDLVEYLSSLRNEPAM